MIRTGDALLAELAACREISRQKKAAADEAKRQAAEEARRLEADRQQAEAGDEPPPAWLIEQRERHAGILKAVRAAQREARDA